MLFLETFYLAGLRKDESTSARLATSMYFHIKNPLDFWIKNLDFSEI